MKEEEVVEEEVVEEEVVVEEKAVEKVVDEKVVEEEMGRIRWWWRRGRCWTTKSRRNRGGVG